MTAPIRILLVDDDEVSHRVSPLTRGVGRDGLLECVERDADAAVAEGWKLLKLTPKFVVATDAAPRDGWEQRRFYEYDVPQNALMALAPSDSAAVRLLSDVVNATTCAPMACASLIPMWPRPPMPTTPT